MSHAGDPSSVFDQAIAERLMVINSLREQQPLLQRIAVLVLMHATSTYPANYAELNLRAIPAMVARYGVPVGYSGHETGIPSSVCAAALGACCVERHITTDRAMWGSDHAASLEPNGISRLVRDIRLWEQAKGDGIKRVYEREVPIIKKLRRVGATV